MRVFGGLGFGDFVLVHRHKLVQIRGKVSLPYMGGRLCSMLQKTIYLRCSISGGQEARSAQRFLDIGFSGF